MPMQELLCDESSDVCIPSTSSQDTMNLSDLPELDHEHRLQRLAPKPAASRKRTSTSTEAGRDPKAMKLHHEAKEEPVCVSPPSNSSTSSSNAYSDQAENHDPEQLSNSESEAEERSFEENPEKEPTEDEEAEQQKNSLDFNPIFASYPKLLSARAEGQRSLPPMLNSNDLGEEEEVWSLMCRKDEMYTRVADYFGKHKELDKSMRFLLLDWVMELCEQERLHRETFYLVVDYIDRFLSVMEDVPTRHLQLAGATALLIATKLEEIYPPSIDKIANYTDGACHVSSIRLYEMLMVQRLEWNLVPITAIHWLSIYFQLLGTKHSLTEDPPADDAKNKDTPLTPPMARVPLAPRNSSNQCGIPRLSADRVGFCCSGEHHKNSCCIPNFLKGEFSRVAKILDVCMLDLDSVKFTHHSVLPAALLFCIYEPDSLISSVTGYTRAQLEEAIEFVEPIVQVCLESPAVHEDTKTTFPEIPDSDLHNIQLYDADIKVKIEKAAVVRRERQRKIVTATRRRRVLPGRN
ncbi:hypothetical protein L596_008817 [Steinernema carpocapsae]|uniref:Cyclin-like domain-containing protein n=1 Tax=Steinernema carpocapsae TaxID=34508 RepID=A0A4U5PDR6_STECR|nr:hypothetical protein L596_008817 [Steinernema carpocapsae]